MTVAVGVRGVEQRQLLHAHRVLPFAEVLGQAHAPELLEEPRSIDGGHAHRDWRTAAIGHDRSVHAATDFQRHVTKRSVRFPYLDGFGVRLERLHLSVEHVPAVFQHQAIQIRLGRIVRRLGPAQVVGEALAEHREADPHRAV